MQDYRDLGYPLEEFEDEIRFVHAKSEKLPFEDRYFDAVISRNALDHVDDFEATCQEICRGIKPSGIVHILLNYHAPTPTEPQLLNDELVVKHFDDMELKVVQRQNDAWGF